MSAARRSVGRTIALAPRFALMGLVRAYQLTLSPLLGPRCKYHPSCSHYGMEALRHHGAIRGTMLAVWRVLRCNPWSHGGVDDVPMKGERLFRLTRNNGGTRASSPSSLSSVTNS